MKIPSIAPNLVTGQPPIPRPADSRWEFGSIQRTALQMACPGGWKSEEVRLRIVESDGVPT